MEFIDFSRDYQRLFRFDNFGHSCIDLWMDSYKKRDAMVVTLGDNTTFMLPRKILEAQLEEGVAFFQNESAFEVYRLAYEEFMPKFPDFCNEQIVGKKALDRETATTFFELATAIWDYFYKTEFFYLDKAYEVSKNDPAIQRRLDVHYRLKERAREAHITQGFFGPSSYHYVFGGILGRQFGIPSADVMNYGVLETIALFDARKVSEEVLKERRITRIVATKNGGKAYCFGEVAKNDILELQEKTADVIPYGKHELKGMPANKGVVRGKIKIIISDPNTISRLSEEFEKMQQGDILVAETTSPEFMPALPKAGAVLADQGGLLSHAAVVSREFGIPCIVAMKYATKIFKDGDLVEVDGEKGIVRKIS